MMETPLMPNTAASASIDADAWAVSNWKWVSKTVNVIDAVTLTAPAAVSMSMLKPIGVSFKEPPLLKK